MASTVRHAPLLLVVRFFRLAWGVLPPVVGSGCLLRACAVRRRAPAVCRGLLSPVVGLLLLLLLLLLLAAGRCWLLLLSGGRCCCWLLAAGRCWLLLSGGRPAKSWKQMCQQFPCQRRAPAVCRGLLSPVVGLLLLLLLLLAADAAAVRGPSRKIMETNVPVVPLKKKA